MNPQSNVDGPVSPVIAVRKEAPYDTAATSPGSIDHLTTDNLPGELPYAVLEFGSFYGMRKGRHAIAFSVLKHRTE